MEELMDAELVKRAQNGEGRAFDVLTERYRQRVTHLVYRYVGDTDTAMDLVQDIFFKIFRNLVKFKGESKFSSWMFRIAVNDCIDYKRRLKVRKEQSLETFQEYGFDVADPHGDNDIEANFETARDRERVQQALTDLPPKQKAVVVMKVYEDMTFDEIAEVLDQPVSTIKSRLYKALNNLGSTLRRNQIIEGSLK